MKIINDYGKASGQQLNISKSSILFGNKVPAEIKTSIKQALGISNEGGMGTYLGLPEKICGSKKQAFAYIQDRLNTRVTSWSAKLLSKGGKEVLLKLVAQALPTYIMSCFLLPQDIIKKLTSSISCFWWSSKQNNRGLHWIAWDKICLPHEEGGLDSETLRTLISHYLRSNSGDCSSTQTLYWHECLKDAILKTPARFRLTKSILRPTYGEASWLQNHCSKPV